MQYVTGNQVATSDWATISAVSIDTNTNGEKNLAYYFEATTNDVEFKIQGSINGVNFIDLNTVDANIPDDQNVVITVLAAGSAVAFVAPENDYHFNTCYRHYRVQIRGVSPYGTGYVYAFAK